MVKSDKFHSFFQKIHGASFWGIVSLLLLISLVGLTVSLSSTPTSLRSSAYNPGSTNILDMGHYVAKFGFYNPTSTYKISNNTFSALKNMMPYAFTGADKFNQRYRTTVEPELIVWWSYAEGIGGRVTFSNCHDSVYSITNCSTPSNWQLGYGIQFSAVKGILVNAFTDTHGNPNDTNLVRSVGQNVLNIDKNNGSNCGCSFPSLTVGQIASGISYGGAVQDNFWASILSRDPAINAYINAEALQISWFNRQLAWGWGSYYKNNWQLYSNYLATILNNWISLGGCTALTNCYSSPSPTPLPTAVPVFFNPVGIIYPTNTPTPTQTPTPLPTPTVVAINVTPEYTPAPSAFNTLTSTPSSDLNSTDTSTTSANQNSSTDSGSLTSTQITSAITPTTTEVLQPAPAVSIAPIEGIPAEPTIIIPTPTPVEYIAGQKSNQTLSLLSFMGVLISLLLFIPLTRHKVIGLFHTLLWHNLPTNELKQAIVNKTYFVKVISQGNPSHVYLIDDSGRVDAYYKGEVKEGFALVKGELEKKDGFISVNIKSIEPAETPLQE